MNNLGKSIVRKLGYSFGANLVSLFVSVLTVSVIPKYMPVEDYGIYQLFLFYFSYVGFLHFGVLGGAIIRYAGCTYDQLDYVALKSQCVFLFLILLFLSAVLCLINQWLLIFTDPWIIIAFLVSMFAQHIIWYSISMLQMSNRIEDASKLLFEERVSWCVLSIGAVFLRWIHADNIILVFTITRLLVMVYSLIFVPEITRAPISINKRIIDEFKINFQVGFPITLGDICSLLVIGIIRFTISNVWDITVFAKTSLVLSITLFFLSFISSASVVLLPALKQLKNKVANDLYISLNQLTSLLFLIVLIAYFPMRYIIAIWVPKYADSLSFMGILFPILYFESKFNLLVVTYLKKILKTKIIFSINLICMILSIIGSLIFGYGLKNLRLSILLITIVLGLRYSFGEIILSEYLGSFSKNFHQYLRDIVVIVLFMIITEIANSHLYIGFFCYLLTLILYTVISLKKVVLSWHFLKNLMKK